MDNSSSLRKDKANVNLEFMLRMSCPMNKVTLPEIIVCLNISDQPGYFHTQFVSVHSTAAQIFANPAHAKA